MLEQLKLSDAQEMSHLFVRASVLLAPPWHWLAGCHQCALGCFGGLVFWVGLSSQHSVQHCVYTAEQRAFNTQSCVCVYMYNFKQCLCCCIFALKKKEEQVVAYGEASLYLWTCSGPQKTGCPTQMWCDPLWQPPPAHCCPTFLPSTSLWGGSMWHLLTWIRAADAFFKNSQYPQALVASSQTTGRNLFLAKCKLL